MLIIRNFTAIKAGTVMRLGPLAQAEIQSVNVVKCDKGFVIDQNAEVKVVNCDIKDTSVGVEILDSERRDSVRSKARHLHEESIFLPYSAIDYAVSYLINVVGYNPYK